MRDYLAAIGMWIVAAVAVLRFGWWIGLAVFVAEILIVGIGLSIASTVEPTPTSDPPKKGEVE